METESDGSGQIFHVVGDILLGMHHMRKKVNRPDASETFVHETQSYFGKVIEVNLGRLEEACWAVFPPGAQLRLNGSPIKPSQPIRLCREWVQEAKEKIIREGIITP